ncbi:MAG: reverse transcriptase-like protein [Anaerolineae bacterium]|nr:reverse transcriptase-like protein [Anaerolineae bacterium]
MQSDTTEYEIYVDGTFRSNLVGYGVVILKSGHFHAALFGIAKTDAEHRQIGGEITAVAEALRWCQKHQVKAVTIYYDYEGLEAWVTGRFETGQPLTQRYAEFVRSSGVRITWHKVTSHTGVKWNEKADQLASQAIALRRESTTEPVPSAQDSLLSEAERVARAFADFLGTQSIQAEFVGTFNGTYARVAALSGFFDLYNTPKKRLSPYIHKVNHENKARLQTAWQAFRQQSQS